LALYVVWPLSIGSVEAIDTRWLLPGYLLLFCGTAGSARPPATRALCVLTALVVVNAGVAWSYGRAIDADLAAFDRALARLPAGTRVLPLVTHVRRHGVRIAPYRHYAMWHVINAGGRVPGLFTFDGVMEGQI
ncbi:MAG: hypothetical protein M3154_11715, partial [Candidatus Eremiobacteraeota bacterium]|nr:hypothetical protein [Candidatus Eremiobacteraeota bacterium]